jgi:hypothetical protein
MDNPENLATLDTQNNMCWISPHTNKHKYGKYDMSPPTNNWR